MRPKFTKKSFERPGRQNRVMVNYYCKRSGHFEAQKIMDLRGILL